MAFGRGSRGAGVRLLQEKLANWIRGLHELGQGGDMVGLIPDGAYGQNTQFVVAKFQAFAGLPTSGHADYDTLEALQIPGDTTADGTVVVESTGGGV